MQVRSVKLLAWRATLRFAKHAGLFHLARFLTKDGLRILCYHGIAIANEYKFRGTLFVRADFFRRRLTSLLAQKYPILPLGSALTLLDSASLPPCATVITMDDGWRGVYSHLLEITNEHQIPIVLYAASYYIQHNIPVFSVAASFLFWRTRRSEVDLPHGLGTFQLGRLVCTAEEVVQSYGRTLPPDQKMAFLRDLAVALDVLIDDIENAQLFHLLTAQQISDLARSGVDVQLHTHNHEWSLEDARKNADEIDQNRTFLRNLVPGPLEHFCYPSGVHSMSDSAVLASLGIRSAVTIEPGLNYSDTSRYALYRILDGERVPKIEFEAEMSGFTELIRALRRRRLSTLLRRRFSPHCAGDSTQTRAAQNASFYDQVHADGNDPATKALYAPMLRQVIRLLDQGKWTSIVDVGCGNGFLAELILHNNHRRYMGFDFSEVALSNAVARTGRPDLFYLGDARLLSSYPEKYDAIVCTEVLEHIENDIDVIRKWREGTWCICSVPNFDYEGHVRFFSSAEAVSSYYGSVIEIHNIVAVARPVNPTRDLGAYLRQLRWSRDKPSRVLGYLGVQKFRRLGGWFVFSGIRKTASDDYVSDLG